VPSTKLKSKAQGRPQRTVLEPLRVNVSESRVPSLQELIGSTSALLRFKQSSKENLKSLQHEQQQHQQYQQQQQQVSQHQQTTEAFQRQQQCNAISALLAGSTQVRTNTVVDQNEGVKSLERVIKHSELRLSNQTSESLLTVLGSMKGYHDKVSSMVSPLQASLHSVATEVQALRNSINVHSAASREDSSNCLEIQAELMSSQAENAKLGHIVTMLCGFLQILGHQLESLHTAVTTRTVVQQKRLSALERVLQNMQSKRGEGTAYATKDLKQPQKRSRDKARLDYSNTSKRIKTGSSSSSSSLSPAITHTIYPSNEADANTAKVHPAVFPCLVIASKDADTESEGKASKFEPEANNTG